MAQSSMSRLQVHKKQSRKGFKFFLSLIIIVIILIGIVVFFPSLNNTWRSVSGNDTPADHAVKTQIVKRLKAEKTGNAQKDQLIDRGTSVLNKTKMSTIMQAATEKQKAANLLQKTTAIPPQRAQTIVNAVFSDPQLTSTRQAIAQGDWYQAYQDYEKLSDQQKQTLVQLYNGR